MIERKSQSGKTGATQTRSASPDALREDAHPKMPAGETKQPYASELDDYHGGKTKPPKEKPTTDDA